MLPSLGSFFGVEEGGGCFPYYVRFFTRFLFLPAEPAFLARDANTNTNNKRLELGVSFSSGLPGWFRSCFFVGFIKDFSGTAQISLGFSARRSGLGVSFSAGRGGSCWPSSRNAGLRISVIPHKFH